MMAQRYLIVNADDFNTDAQRSRGILQAARTGIVTSTTVLTNLPFEPTTLEELKNVFGPAVGVHLNLTRGRPLSTGGKTLVGDDGLFLDKAEAWRRALMRGYALPEVEREFCAQVSMLLDQGLVPSHLDGNNHIHVFPGIAQVVGRVAKRYGIRILRLPLEKAWTRRFQWEPKRWFIGRLSGMAAAHFAEAGLIWPARFAGIGFPRPGSLEDLSALLRRLPEWGTELMCHPGFSGSEGAFSTRQREEELAALTHPEVLEEVHASGVALVSFGDLVRSD